MNWDDVRIFLAVARTGQILAASKRLGLNHATLSRRLTSLEEALKTRLFIRRTNGCELTAEGEVFLASAERMETEMLAVQASLEAKARSDPDFWSVVGRTELQLLQAAASGGVAAAQSHLAAEFADLQRRVSAPTEWRSVYDTERFVLDRYARRAGAAEQRACRELLAQLAGYAWPTGV